ncbi:hypothetical protein M3Y97_00759900 [Aphelenchoides bicaudatus]|nr:hypothetical protein M3Y97_00759900 [Aphelenchoides bicaudatus]
MDSNIIPEVTNPVPQLNATSAPERVDITEGTSISRSSSAARFNEPGRSRLTELTGDDIFRMKELRQSDSVSISEMAERSEMAEPSMIDGDGNEERNGSNDNTNPLFDPDSTQNESSQLNEEDLFRMKSLSISRADALSEQAGQSAVSNFDSVSNIDERANQEEDGDDNDDTSGADQNEVSDEHDYFKALPQTDLTFSGHYVFNRNRAPKPDLNNETLVELYYPFETLSQPPGIPMDEYLRMFRQSKVYLIGTAHFSRASQDDVRRTIAETQPDVIFVELCQSRMAILSLDEELLLKEAQNLTREKVMAIIRENGVVQGLLQVMLLSISAHITSLSWVSPLVVNSELLIAPSFNVQGCRLLLGDRPVQITLQRALSSLGFFQKIRLVFHIILANFSNVTQEDVERCKNKDLLESLLNEMAGEFPQLSKIFVEERDQYMTYVLHSVMQKYTAEKIAAWNQCRDRVEYQPLNIVGVVGLGHMKGIEQYWNKHIDQAQLLTIPEPSRFSRFVRFGVRICVYGGIAYGCYRVGRFTFNKVSPMLSK